MKETINKLKLLLKGILFLISLKLRKRLFPLLERFDPIEIKGLYMVNSIVSISAVMAAKKLDLLAILSDKAQSKETLSQKTKCDSTALFRLLRALVAINVIDEKQPNCFTATPLSRWLDAFLLIPFSHMGLKSWHYTYKSIQTGQPVWVEAYGEPIYDYLDKHPEESADFDLWNTQTAQSWLPHIIRHYDFKPFKKIVDLGGGQGHFITKILEANSHLQGVLFDRPEVVKESIKPLREKGLAESCVVEGGSFFESVPQGGDIYSFCRVLFNWGDKEVINILKCCHEVMTKEHRLIIIEAILPEKKHPAYTGAALNDLNLLTHFGGKMRSKEEWTELLDTAGYSIKRIIEPNGFMGFVIIEGVIY